MKQIIIRLLVLVTEALQYIPVVERIILKFKKSKK
jgi:hypothetical protein